VEVSPYDEEREPRVMILGASSLDMAASALLPAGNFLAQDLLEKHYINVWSGNKISISSGIVVPPEMTASLLSETTSKAPLQS
jgi:hypothetical protein